MSIFDILFPEGSPVVKSKKAVRVLGIDLGTTNSTVAEIIYKPAEKNDIQIRCLAVEQPTGNRSHWHPLVPSVVALHDGREIVGEGARLLRSRCREEGMIENGNLFTQVKNDMGLRRTYHMAPAGYRCAAEVSGRLLAYLKNAAMKDNSQAPARTTVTVPASFQTAQRADTLRAASLAKLTVQSGDLLDEPIAAFIAYLADHQDRPMVSIGETKNLLVFDFGGGTCDVALFRLSTDLAGRMIVSSLSVSRYNRLGGGDIDQAILYKIVLPQILEQNGLDRHAFDYETKKTVIEPAFISVAEQLKIGVCEKLAQYAEDEDWPDEMEETLHRKFALTLNDGTEIILMNPTLDLKSFNDILAPFLDENMLFVRETEYFQTLSIFVPVLDALHRCELKPDQIDLCLLAGGSCLIPQMGRKLSTFFKNSEILSFANADAMQTAVARGAALNALSLAICERPIIQPVCQESISIITGNGMLDLVGKGASLPWPPHGGYEEITRLMLPECSSGKAVPIRVEVVAREEGGNRTLLREFWEIPAPIGAGERIRLEYRYDENQVLDVRAFHAERDDVKPFQSRKEHPLTHISNPQSIRLRIEETEEKLRTGVIQPHERKDIIRGLAENCAEIRQYEKAAYLLADLLRQSNEPDASIINQMALYYGCTGDEDTEERLYREAGGIDPNLSAPWFNLGLLMQKQKRLDEAKAMVEKAIRVQDDAPYYVLQAKIVRDMGKEFAVTEFLDMAWKRFKKPAEMSDWELGWYITAAEMREDKDALSAARSERNTRRIGNNTQHHDAQGVLPVLSIEGVQ
jgi:molecular chaperone DnaK (HSP70)